MSVPRSALLLGSSVRVIVTIARCLSEHGITVHVGSLLPDEAPVRSRAISTFNYLPAEPQAFAQELLKLVRSENVGLVYPCGDEALEILGACEADLAGNIKIASPPARVFRTVLDKGETLKIADQIGIPIPKEYRFSDLSALIQKGVIQSPLIAKARRKDNSAPRIRHFETARNLIDELNSNPNCCQNVVIQEFVPGNGVGIEVLMHRGEPIVLFQHRRLTEFPVEGGVSVRARSESVDATLGEYAVKLLRALEWEGVAMVEFRSDPKSGRVVLMEVNGRYWGSLPLSYFAGVEFPWYEWQLHEGMDPAPQTEYDLVTMRWTAGEIERTTQVIGEVVRGRMSAGDGLRDMGRLVTGFLSPARDAVWRWNDRAPAWIDLRAVWKRAFRPQIARAQDALLPWYKEKRSDRRVYGSVRAGKLFRKLSSNSLVTRPERPEILRKRILVLCHGNIIRSPFVEHRLKQLLPDAKIASAGLACISGRPADPRAILAARSYNVDLGSHRAKPLTKKLLSEADVILTMDCRNSAMLLAVWPHAVSKVHCVTNWVAGDAEIDDPYEGDLSAVTQCYRRLDSICRVIAREGQQSSAPRTDCAG